MLVLIDNYDSFTYNLVQYFGELGQELQVVRNDELGLPQLEELQPTHLVVSAGPCTPHELEASKRVIRHFAGKVPILGICLGHLAIGQLYGAQVVPAAEPVHGKVSAIYHDGQGVYRNLPRPFSATRYHSLVLEPQSMPQELEVTSRTEDDVIMGIRHRHYAIEGVQFHPESILTECGKQLLQNFLQMAPQTA